MPVFFINSALLAVAWAALAPLVIHLLHRQRARDDALSTLRFLRAGFAANRRRVRLRNYLVLALRVLAVLLLVAALARPAYRGELPFRKGTAPVSAVIVMDNSVSMSYETAAGRNFDRAGRMASRVISALPPGSRVALAVTGLGPRGESFDREFTFNRASIETAIDKLDVSACGGDCVRALQAAYAMLGESAALEGAGGSEVYVITDLMRHSWPSTGPPAAPGGVSTVVLDVGTDVNENFFLADVSARGLSSPISRIDVESSVASGDLAAARLVEAYVDGVKRAERLASLPSHDHRPVVFDLPVVSAAQGPQQGWVTLADSDPLLSDNTRFFTIQPAAPVSCLLVTHRKEGAQVDTGFFLKNALEPPALAGATFARVSCVDYESFKPDDLEGKDVLVVADIPTFTRELRDATEGFLDAGKGVVLFAGTSALPEPYDFLLARHFGVHLSGIMSAPAGKPASLGNCAFDHPMLAAFAGGRNGNLSAARFFRWRELAASPGGSSGAVELAGFDGYGPALVFAQAGSGRAILAAFGPTREDGDLPLRASFVPLVNEIARYAAGRQALGPGRGSADFAVGAGISFAVGPSATETRASLRTPLGGKPVEISIPPGSTSFVYRPFFPGNYTVSLPGADDAGFSVNTDVGESLLERIAPEEIADVISGAVVAKDPGERELARVYGRTRGARELFDVLIVGVLAVLALEEYLANRMYSRAREGES